MTSLPQFVVQMIDDMPPAGTGIHTWLFKVARQLHAHYPAGEIIQLLENRVINCGRHVPRREIVEAVRDALPVAWERDGRTNAQDHRAKWPNVNTEQRMAIIRDFGGLADLWEQSPMRIDDDLAVLLILFPGNPLLCCGRSNSDFDTMPLNEWHEWNDLQRQQLIVPNPMLSEIGVTKDGKESAHALSSTGPRRFLIVEFDSGTTDEHAALLVHLASFAPLACAVHSGGKSLHGWFFVEGEPDDKVLKFFRYAVSLGADSKLWTRSQFCRLPGGIRDNGNRQFVFFFNPQPLENN